MTNTNLLPTGKAHLSFSELADWMRCSWRHKLRHISKINIDPPNENLVFGTAVHSMAEHYLKTKEIDENIAKNIINNECDKLKLLTEGKVGERGELVKLARKIVEDIAVFFDETFPGWELVDVEENLMENVGKLYDRHEGLSFKGFVDCIISIPGKKEGEKIYWVLDFKTAGRPWTKEKLMDTKVTYQAVLYKTFWSMKHDIPMKSIKCGFITLLKTGKSGKICKLIPISVGDVTSKRSLDVLDNAFSSIKKGIAIKDRSGCKWCEFKDTEYCK